MSLQDIPNFIDFVLMLLTLALVLLLALALASVIKGDTSARDSKACTLVMAKHEDWDHLPRKEIRKLCELRYFKRTQWENKR